MDYKQQIIDKLGEIEDQDILNYIYIIVSDIVSDDLDKE